MARDKKPQDGSAQSVAPDSGDAATPRRSPQSGLFTGKNAAATRSADSQVQVAQASSAQADSARASGTDAEDNAVASGNTGGRENAAAAEAVQANTAPATDRTASAPETGDAGRGFGFGLRSRRERRDWAKEHGYDFAKKDDYLVDDWSDGGVSLSGVARDVVSGSYRSREFHIADVGDRTLMAMRRPIPSDVELDIRRTDCDRTPRTDCEPVCTIHGWVLSSTSPESAERTIDERVERACAHLRDAVVTIWAQSQWVIAELRGSTAADWEDLAASLADLSDAAMTLPPSSPEQYELADDDPQEHDPTRAATAPIELAGETDTPSPEFQPRAGSRKPVEQPAQPVEFPSRVQQQTHGTVEHSRVGGDDVDPIADESVNTHTPRFDGTTVIREPDETSTIFDNLSSELGTNPLADEPQEPDRIAPKQNS